MPLLAQPLMRPAADWIRLVLGRLPPPTEEQVLAEMLPTVARIDWSTHDQDIRQAVLTSRNGRACRVPTPPEMLRRCWWRDFTSTYGLESTRLFDLIDQHNPAEAARLAVDSIARRFGVTSLTLEMAMRQVRLIAQSEPDRRFIVLADHAGQPTF